MRNVTLLLPLLLLASCGGGTSTSVDADSFFDALSASAKEAAKGDTMGIRCDYANGNFGIKTKDDEGKASHFTMKAERLAMDLRFDGLQATEAKDLKASLLSTTSRNTSGGKLYLSGDVPSYFETLIGSTGVPLNLSAYLSANDNGDPTLYLDMTKMALIRVALQTAIQQKDPSFTLPKKSKVTFSGDSVTGLNEYLPLSARIQESVEETVNVLKDAYKTTPSDFLFDDNAGVKTIVFKTVSWESFRRIAGAFELPDVSLSSSFDVDADSFFDKAEETANLDRFSLSLSYGESGITRFDVDASLTFHEEEDASFAPEGTWAMSASFDVLYDAEASPVVLSSRDAAGYSELQFPNADTK